MAENEFVERYRVMQRYVGWTEEDAGRVALLGPLVLAHADELIADFYAEVRRHPQAAAAITGGSEQIHRLSESLRQWLVELLDGQYDDQYMARRWRVGYRHVEIGLAQRFASLALSRLRAGIVRSVQLEWRGDPDERLACLASLHKLIDLEHALIQDAYEYEHVRRERHPVPHERAGGQLQPIESVAVVAVEAVAVVVDEALAPVEAHAAEGDLADRGSDLRPDALDVEEL